jgi:Protein of unknown function (DUF1003)
VNFRSSVELSPVGAHCLIITERVSEVITKIVGNMTFLLGQLALISSWILVDLHMIPGVSAFDPFPFGVLALIVSSEDVFLTNSSTASLCISVVLVKHLARRSPRSRPFVEQPKPNGTYGLQVQKNGKRFLVPLLVPLRIGESHEGEECA